MPDRRAGPGVRKRGCSGYAASGPAVAYDVTPSGHNIVGLARFRHGIVVASYDGGDIKPQIHL